MYYNTTITPGSTGNRTISPGFLPTGYRITVGAKGGLSGAVALSVGQCDNTGYTSRYSLYSDSVGPHQSSRSAGDGKLVLVYERVSGTITEVAAASHVSFNTSTPGVTFNVTTVNTSYQYNVELWN